MSATEKTISSLIKTQLPDFIRAEHPKFKRFLELYYQWIETNDPTGVSPVGGNTVYQAMNIGDYRDIDQTPDEFIRFFKTELLPYFPDKTALDIRKILKSAREFYSKKGSVESVKWLFKALFNEDIEIFYPKEQILKTSDGKWKKPKAFRITVGETNKSVDVNLLKKRLAVGVESGATCVIESANRTIDQDNGKEIIEIYISSIRKYFYNGEYININYTDANGIDRVFSERIVGTISNIYLDSNIKTDPRQIRRGLLYNVGDPVVITSGLALTAEAQAAKAIVGNVSTGSIEAVTTLFPGYGYRAYPNTEVLVLRSTGDFVTANLYTDLEVFALNLTSNTINSNRNFIETINYDISVIGGGTAHLDDTNYSQFTTNNLNILVNVVEYNSNIDYEQHEQVWANGTNYFDAKFTAKIATSNTTGPFCSHTGSPGATDNLLLYDVVCDGTLSVVLNGQDIQTKNTSKKFVFNSITNSQVPANGDSQLAQCFNFTSADTGGVALISVINGGAGFQTPPTLQLTSEYVAKGNNIHVFKELGLIAHVYINNGGTGYANGDTVTFTGRGYNAEANVTVNGLGSIVSVNILNRGEGYLARPACRVNTVGGTGAVLTAYLFGDGYESKVETSAIGRIKDVKLLYRGYDYVSRPNVSLKVMDTVINPILESENFAETEFVYQGDSLSTSVFRANVKSYDRTTNVLRLYDYSGKFNSTIAIVSANGLVTYVDTTARVPAPIQYPNEVIATGLDNPAFYGDGKAKALAAFANGLIEFNGFYLNTDGFLSADKVLQDGHVYHNYSYVIQSNKDLVEYQTTLKNIAHPSGMIPISKKIIYTEENASSDNFHEINYISPANLHSNIQVIDSYSNVVTGNLTAFLTGIHTVNVGDLFIIKDGDHSLRSISRVVTSVESQTELLVDGNFIYVGQGKASTNSGNAWLNITGNSNTITDFIKIGDQIRVNLYSSLNVSGTVNVSGDIITGNTTGSNTTHFVSNVVVGNEVTINNETRTVTVVTDDSTITVNSAFTYAATDKYMIVHGVMVKSVVDISENNIIMDSVYPTFSPSKTNLVYQIVPDYTSQDYSYQIVTLTSED